MVGYYRYHLLQGHDEPGVRCSVKEVEGRRRCQRGPTLELIIKRCVEERKRIRRIRKTSML